MDRHLIALMLLLGPLTGVVQSDVFKLPPGLTSLEMVPVGNPGNPADTEVMTDGTRGYGGVSYAYRIGRYEVTAAQYCEFLNAVAASDPYGLYNESMNIDSGRWEAEKGCNIRRSGPFGSYTYAVAGDYANRPVNFVSWGDAARFCNWLQNGQPKGVLTGKPTLDAGLTEDGAYHLNGAVGLVDLLAVSRGADWRWATPTEDEWYKAAYHKNDGVTSGYFDYPTGSNSVPGRDMTEATNSGNNASFSGPYPIDPPHYTTLPGEFELSESPYGTFDQGGNVWEWTETHQSDWLHVLRGGSIFCNPSCLHASSRFMFNNNPDIEWPDIGIRVVSVPEPSALALLFMTAIGLAVHWWQRRR